MLIQKGNLNLKYNYESGSQKSRTQGALESFCRP